MSSPAVPNGWEVGARLRHPDGTEGFIVYRGKEWAVLDTGRPHDVTLAYHDNAGWRLVPPVPPIPEDREEDRAACDDPAGPKPAAVAARHRAAAALAVEVEALTFERDALREALEQSEWDRDAAQSEAARLREEVLESWAEHAPAWRNGLTAEVGRLLVSGDDPPPIPADGEPDVVLVSLTTGARWVRSAGYDRTLWELYGNGHHLADWSDMAETGPWVTVGTFGARNHRQVVDAKRRLGDACANLPRPGAMWPEETHELLERLWVLDRQWPRDPAAIIGALTTLTLTLRSLHEDETKR